MTEWISVNDMLPQNESVVIVSNIYGFTWLAEYFDSEVEEDSGDFVTFANGVYEVNPDVVCWLEFPDPPITLRNNDIS